MTAVTDGVAIVVEMVGDVFTMITGNPVLAAFIGAALLSTAIGVFSTLRQAAQ